MDLCAAILSQGKSSRLYKRLILDDKLAVDVSASQNGSKLQGSSGSMSWPSRGRPGPDRARGR